MVVIFGPSGSTALKKDSLLVAAAYLRYPCVRVRVHHGETACPSQGQQTWRRILKPHTKRPQPGVNPVNLL